MCFTISKNHPEPMTAEVGFEANKQFVIELHSVGNGITFTLKSPVVDHIYLRRFIPSREIANRDAVVLQHRFNINLVMPKVKFGFRRTSSEVYEGYHLYVGTWLLTSRIEQYSPLITRITNYLPVTVPAGAQYYLSLEDDELVADKIIVHLRSSYLDRFYIDGAYYDVYTQRTLAVIVKAMLENKSYDELIQDIGIQAMTPQCYRSGRE